MIMPSPNQEARLLVYLIGRLVQLVCFVWFFSTLGLILALHFDWLLGRLIYSVIQLVILVCDCLNDAWWTGFVDSEAQGGLDSGQQKAAKSAWDSKV